MPSKVYQLYPAFPLAAQGEDPDTVKIPENTRNVREITTRYSAQKQGKTCVRRILDTHKKGCKVAYY